MDSHWEQQQHCGGVLAEAAPPFTVHCSSSRQLTGQPTGLQAGNTVAAHIMIAQLFECTVHLLQYWSMSQLISCNHDSMGCRKSSANCVLRTAASHVV